MQHLGTYDRIVLSGAELREDDWVIAIDDNAEDGIVSGGPDDDPALYVNVAAGSYSDSLPVVASSSYVVMRPRPGARAGGTDDLRSAAQQAVDALEEWLSAPSGTFTCDEAAAMRTLIAEVAGPSSAIVAHFDRWHAGTDDAETDCSHEWYVRLQEDPAAPRP